MKKKNYNFSVSLGLIAVTLLLLFSIITIQGTGAWFERSSNLTPDDKVVVTTGDLKLNQVLTNFLGTDTLLPGGYGEVRTVTVMNDGAAGDATFYYSFEFTPNDTNSILWTGNELEIIVNVGIEEVYNGPVNALSFNYAFAKAQGLDLAPGESHEVTFQLFLTEEATIDYANATLSFNVTLSAKQAEGVE